MSNSVAAKETIISLDGTPLAEVTALTGVALARELADVTSFGAGIGRDRKPVLSEIVDITMEMNFLSGEIYALNAHFTAGTVGAFTVLLPETLGTFSFNAFVPKIELVIEFDNIVKATVTLGVNVDDVTYG